MLQQIQEDNFAKILVTLSLAFLFLFWTVVIGVLTGVSSQRLGSVLAETTSSGTMTIFSYPDVVANSEVVLQGQVEIAGQIKIGDIEKQIAISPDGTPGSWELRLSLQEGENNFLVEFIPANSDSQPITKEILITRDTVNPACELDYSQQPAIVGSLVITLQCSEPITPDPQITIDQPGSTDLYSAQMSGVGSTWQYTYQVKQHGDNGYQDGIAKVIVTTNGDYAGNPLESISNNRFEIKTVVDQDATSDDEDTSIVNSDGTTSGTSNDQTTNSSGSIGNSNSSTTTEVKLDPVEQKRQDSIISDNPNTTIESDVLELDSSELPKINILGFSEADLRATYSQGSLIRLTVIYQITGMDLDARFSKYVYEANTDTRVFSGIYLDLYEIDPGLFRRGVTVLPREVINADTGIYSRTIEYRLSNIGDPIYDNALVTASYFLNGQQITEPVSLELRMASTQQVSQGRQINVVQINTSNVADQEVLVISPDSIRTEGITLRGNGPANSRLQIRIYSDPIIAEVITDDQGNWEYTLTTELPPGNHTVYASLVNDEAVPEDFTQIFSFEVAAAEIGEVVRDDQVVVTQASEASVDLSNNDSLDDMPMTVMMAVLISLSAVSGLAAIYLLINSRKQDDDQIIPAI